MENVLVIKHVEFEGPGLFHNVFIDFGYRVDICMVWKEELPDLKKYAAILIMGGSMSVNDTLDYPWLIEEKEFISKAIQQDKIVIGVCLGAQLISNVLGEDVYLGSEPEIGWYPLEYKNEGLSYVFHWHGETYDLPFGVELLASSAICENQIYKYRNTVLALQCHLEMDKQALESIIANCKNELYDGRFVMSESQILMGYDVYAKESLILLRKLLTPLLKSISTLENASF